MASDLGIQTLCFCVYSAISWAYAAVPGRIEKDRETPTVEDLMKPPVGFPSSSITAIKRFEAENFSYLFKRFSGGPVAYDRVQGCVSGSSALILKTFYEMEGPYVEFMKTQFQKPVLLAGPLVPESQNGVLEQKWDKWLSQFPSKSVIYCSFGSETFLTDEQIRELALGLENTGLPFCLVLNFPSNVEAKSELNRTVPNGFKERVEGRGVVHTGWVQQQLILRHESVGCYVCHAGFSSVIEAIVNDCQLVLLPFKLDQFMNSKLVAEDLKAGVEVNRRNEDGYFGKEDISEAISKVMHDNYIDTETCLAIKRNHQKLREFLLNGELQDKFILDLVQQMKAIVHDNRNF